ncbi:MAG: TetR/AcrR family transcriptional regulator [Verrucomicrobia bacterium]|nr:TetR/AcrR family transcriptional regulator [Verrucomicrobiota bacterium]
MRSSLVTREEVLRAALKKFAACGYAGTSVQDIVDAAAVTKPTLYYYFANKAGLYQALIDYAHDERLRLMQEAAARREALPDKLVEVITALFGFLKAHRDLVRLSFSTAFAAPGEIPTEIRYLDKCIRSFEFMHSLVKEGLEAGLLNRRFTSKELTMSIYGLLNIYVMGQFLRADHSLHRRTAEQIVKLFLEGAAGKRAVNHWKRRSAGRSTRQRAASVILPRT